MDAAVGDIQRDRRGEWIVVGITHGVDVAEWDSGE